MSPCKSNLKRAEAHAPLAFTAAVAALIDSSTAYPKAPDKKRRGLFPHFTEETGRFCFVNSSTNHKNVK
jgi:hypothetical protein